MEPSVSFKLFNTAYSKHDFPLTLKPFMFRGFDHIEKTPLSDDDVNNNLFSFYLKHRQPQYKVWSLKKIVVVKFYAPIPTEHFTNIKFKGFRGASRIEEDITLSDLLCMNPSDWISLFMILS